MIFFSAFGESEVLSERLEGANELVVKDVARAEHGRRQVVCCGAQTRVFYEAQQPNLQLLEVVIVKPVAYETEFLFEELDPAQVNPAPSIVSETVPVQVHPYDWTLTVAGPEKLVR